MKLHNTLPKEARIVWKKNTVRLLPGQTSYNMVYLRKQSTPSTIKVTAHTPQLVQLALNGQKRFLLVPDRKQNIQLVIISDNMQKVEGKLII